MNLDAKDVALLKKFWAVGQSAAQISRRLGCSRNGLRQANSFGPKAWLQAANIKTQDKAGPEAKAGVVGCLCPPGGKEGGAEDSREAASEFSKRQLYAMLAEAVRNTG